MFVLSQDAAEAVTPVVAEATIDGRTTRFGYDADGLRLTATTGSDAAATTKRWAWDTNGTLPQIAVEQIATAAGTTTTQQSYAYGPDDEPLALLQPSSGAHAYTHDWLGGTADLLTPAGVPETAYDYDPFGNPRTGPTLPDTGDTGAGAPANPMQFTGAYQDSTTGQGNYYLLARNYNPSTGRFTSTDPAPQGGTAASAYAYANDNPTSFTDPTGAAAEPTEATPSPEDVAKAQQLQSKSMLDVILEAGGQILMEFLGITDLLNCLKGNLGSCVMLIVGSLPWGKIFKAKKIGEAVFRAGKAVLTFLKELDWARAIIRGAERAAEAAKAAAALAARQAAERAAAAKAAAEAAARKAAERAAARAKAAAARAKAATKKAAKKAEDAADDVAESCPVRRNSFPAATPVLLASGAAVAIDQVQAGDTVVATDPQTGQTEQHQVTATIRTGDDQQFVEVTVQDGSDQQTITATDHHPFWSATQGRWVDAADLRPGELLRTAAGTYAQVGAVRSYRGHQPTYNLTIDALHTYYVVAGGVAVLVHNAPRPDQCALLFPGPHAKNGVPASEFGKANTAERAAVQAEGAVNGCHSCGATAPGRASGLWTPDHQPITSLVPEGTPQMLFPHCATCSNRQGNLARKLLGGHNPSGWRATPLGLIVPRSLAQSGWVTTASGLLIPG